MTETVTHVRGARVRAVAGTLVAIAALAGCRPQRAKEPPADTVSTTQPARPSADSIRALGRVTTFVPAGAADTLLEADGVRLTVIPAEGAIATTPAIARGRVLARIDNRDTVAYARFGLAPKGTVYWWADSSAAGWRSLLVPADSTMQPVEFPLVFQFHPDRPHDRPTARWQLAAAGLAVPWVTCVEEGCCSLAP